MSEQKIIKVGKIVGADAETFRNTVKSNMTPAFDLGNEKVITSTGPDGKLVKSNILNPSTGLTVSFKEIEKWIDGNDMSEENVDGLVFLKHENKYYVKSDFTAQSIINPREIGVIGDGKNDDTSAIQRCINISSLTRKPIDFRNLIMKVSSRINIGSNVNVSGGTFLTSTALTTEVFKVDGSNVILDDVFFDFDEKNNYGINLISGSTNISIKNCILKDLKEISGNGIVTCAIRVEDGCSNVQILKCKIENVTPIENSTVGDTSGAARAILVGSVENTLIDDCDFIEIKGFEDGDCVHVQTSITGNVWGQSDVTISNCRFPSIYKRGIKMQCSGGLIFNNKIISSTTETLCTFAAISIFGKNTQVINNKITMARATCVFEIGSINKIGDLEFRGNICVTNPDNSYSNTASTSVLSFLKLNATSGGDCDNLWIEDNIFTGHARAIYLTSNSIFNNVFFRRNNCKYSAIYQDSGVTSNSWEISDNIFTGNGSSSSNGGSDALTLTNPNGTVIKKNVFKSTNGYKIRVSGDVGSDGIEIGDNSIISPNITSFIHKTNVTSGEDKLVLTISQQRKVIEGTATRDNAKEGEFILNLNPGSSKIFGWCCVASSVGETPAVWEPVYTSGGSTPELKIKSDDPVSSSAIPLIYIQGANGVSRFTLGKRTAESGSNTGSNLVLFAYPDGGGAPSEVFSFLRSNGYMGLGISTPSENLDVNGKVRARGGFIIGSTEITIAASSANTATAVPASYDQTWVESFFDEFRDMKAKLIAANLMEDEA